jgi:hypothetical protein
MDPATGTADNGRMHTSDDDYLFFADRALDGMVYIVADLGDELANQPPNLPVANSPYQILTHCLGVLDYWVGHLVAGREIDRDRDAEFNATGQVGELVSRAAKAQQQLHADIAKARPSDPVRGRLNRDWLPADREFTQQAALLHVLEELCQHHGHMELTRDILRADRGS